jgi:hypothetical protein
MKIVSAVRTREVNAIHQIEVLLCPGYHLFTQPKQDSTMESFEKLKLPQVVQEALLSHVLVTM